MNRITTLLVSSALAAPVALGLAAAPAQAAPSAVAGRTRSASAISSSHMAFL